MAPPPAAKVAPKKGTPAPPRLPPGEVAITPPFPIKWMAVAISMETTEEGLSMAQTVNSVNQIAAPNLIAVLVDAQEMAEEEISMNTSLGVRLKSMKQEILSKQKKETADQIWWTPTLIAELLIERSKLDQDFKHRQEDERRKQALDISRKVLEEARAVLDSAKQQQSAAEANIKVYKEQLVRSQEQEKLSGASESDQTTTTSKKNEKSKQTSVAPGKPLKSAKDSKIKETDPSSDEKSNLQKFEELVSSARIGVKNAQEKVVAAESKKIELESSLINPYNAVCIYFCIGLGNKAEFIAELANEKGSIFQAVLNLEAVNIHKVNYENSSLKEGAISLETEQKNEAKIIPQNPVLPILVSELRLLSQKSALQDPVRNLAILDVCYETDIPNPPPVEQKPTNNKKSNEGKAAKDSDKSIPYEDIAKAIVSSLWNVIQKLRAFNLVKEKVAYVIVPEAVPKKEVNMKYYRELLEEVSHELISVPIIVHCMIEQISFQSCGASDLEELGKIKQRQKMHSILQKSFLSVQNILPVKQNCGDKEIPENRMEASEISSQKNNDAETCSHRKKDSHEELIIINEYDRVGRIAASMGRNRPRLHQSSFQRKVIDVPAVEMYMMHLLPVPGASRRNMPKFPLFGEKERKALGISSDNSFRAPSILRYRRLKEVENIISSIKTCFLDSKSEVNLRFEESFPDGLMNEVYSKAKLFLPMEKTFYDETEDCILCILFAAAGDASWKYNISCQVPFGDFYTMFKDKSSYKVRVLSYSMEKIKSNIFDHKYLFLTEGGGLVQCGLPSVSDTSIAPQITFYKDGNVFMLRRTGNRKKEENIFLASLNDGFIISFFVMDEEFGFQLTKPTGEVVEIDSKGNVFLYSTDTASEITCLNRNTVNNGNIQSVRFPDAKSMQDGLDKSPQLSEILMQQKPDRELWRCVLPTGVVVCCMHNGQIKVLLRNGNVTELKKTLEGSHSWVTTNNKGYQVIQKTHDYIPPSQGAETLDAKTNLETKPAVEKGRKSESQDVDKNNKDKGKNPKDNKNPKIDDPGDKKGSKSSTVKKSKDSPEIVASKLDDLSNAKADITSAVKSTSMATAPQSCIRSGDSSKPCLLLMPQKKVTHISDPDNRITISSREDMVMSIESVEEKTLFVQHADGTQFETHFSSSCNEDRWMISDPISNNGDHKQMKNLDSEENSGLPTEDRKSNTSSISPCWLMHKGKHPAIRTLGDELTVEITTEISHYLVKLNKKNGEFLVTLPGGSTLHTSGTSVILDVLDSESQYVEDNNLDTWEHMHTQGKGSYQENTNSLYKFDLACGSLHHTDRSCVGFRIHEGLKFEILPSSNESNPIQDSEKIPADQHSAHDVYPKGPLLRIFVMFDGGHGQEILHNKMFEQLRSKAKSDPRCTLISEANDDDEDVNLHTFIINHGYAFNIFDTSWQQESRCSMVSAKGGQKMSVGKDNSQHMDTFRFKRSLSSLSKILDPPAFLCMPYHSRKLVSYRKIFEFPEFSENQITKIKDMWKMIAKQLKELSSSDWDATIVSENMGKTIEYANLDLTDKKLQVARDIFMKDGLYVRSIVEKMCQEEYENHQAIFEIKRNYRKQGEDSESLDEKRYPCIHIPVGMEEPEYPIKSNRKTEICYFRCAEWQEMCENILKDIQSQAYKSENCSTTAIDTEVASLVEFLVQQLEVSESNTTVQEDAAIEPLPSDISNSENVQEKSKVLDREDRKSSIKFRNGQRLISLCRSLWPVIGRTSVVNRNSMKVRSSGLFLASKPMTEQEFKSTDGNMKKKLNSTSFRNIALPGVSQLTEIGPEKRRSSALKTIEHFTDTPRPSEVRRVRFSEIIQVEEKTPYLTCLYPYHEETSVPRIEFEDMQEMLQSDARFPEAIWQPNEEYIQREATNYRPLMTTSMNLLRSLRPLVDRPQFCLSPEIINFNLVPYGSIHMQVATLQNLGYERGWFRVKCKEKNLKIMYKHGMVASGMVSFLHIYLHALRKGDFYENVTIESEIDMYMLPVRAFIQ